MTFKERVLINGRIKDDTIFSPYLCCFYERVMTPGGSAGIGLTDE